MAFPIRGLAWEKEGETNNSGGIYLLKRVGGGGGVIGLLILANDGKLMCQLNYLYSLKSSFSFVYSTNFILYSGTNCFLKL